MIHEIAIADLESSIKYFQSSDKPVTGQAKEFVELAEFYINGIAG
jgi:hypothetical protein